MLAAARHPKARPDPRSGSHPANSRADVNAADTDALDLMIAGACGWNLDFNRDGNLDQDDLDAHAAYRTTYPGCYCLACIGCPCNCCPEATG